VGCVIGGALALFSILFLMPHMETIASLVVLVSACAAAHRGLGIRGLEASGSVIAGLQLAFRFFLQQSFKVTRPTLISTTSAIAWVGILFGLVVTGTCLSNTSGPSALRIESQTSQ